MEVKVLKFDVDWLEIKNACRQTVNMGESKKEPTEEWKKKLLIARHSPLRLGNVLIELRDIPYFVHTHLVRHNVGVVPFVGTSREDRTGVKRDERKQTDLVTMQMWLNVEALLNISEKRLCSCADIETIKVWREVIKKISEYDKAISWACVPSCVRTGGCIEEFGGCKFYENLMKNEPIENQIDLINRYDVYNRSRKL